MSTERLPRRVQELIDLIGWSETLRLLKAKGGTAVYFPKDPENAEHLKYVLERHTVAILCRQFGGRDSAVRLPKPDKMLLRLRNLQIVSEYHAGCSTGEIAARFGLSDRMIQNIVCYRQTNPTMT